MSVLQSKFMLSGSFSHLLKKAQEPEEFGKRGFGESVMCSHTGHMWTRHK